MTAHEHFLTVDADGHVLEPRDTWQKYLELEYRADAIRIEKDHEGLEVLLVENRPHPALRGTLGALGGIEMDAKELRTPGARSYEDGCPPGGYDPAARLSVMDDEKIDIALLYPTIGIAWEGLVRDPKLATAYSRAYNRWIVDFCSHDRRRLVPIAHICLKDPEGAVAEVQRARKDGCAGVYLSPDPPARDGRQFDDPELVPFWETVQDLDMPIAFHVVALPPQHARCLPRQQGSQKRQRRGRVRLHLPGARRHGGLHLDDDPRHVREVPTPALRRARGRLELDHRVARSPGPQDRGDAQDYVIWASDYPHLDASFDVVGQIREKIAVLPESAQRKILGLNAAKFYGLPL